MEDYVLIYIFIHVLLTIFATVLTFRCNDNKLDVVSIFYAIFSPYIFIFITYLKDKDALINTLKGFA